MDPTNRDLVDRNNDTRLKGQDRSLKIRQNLRVIQGAVAESLPDPPDTGSPPG